MEHTGTPLVEVIPAGSFQLPVLETFGALAIASVVVAWLLYTQRPTVTRRTVLACVPWIAVGATLHTLHAAGVYPPSVGALFAGPAAYLVAFLAWGLAWFGMLQFSLDGRAVGCVPSYLGAMGVGAVAVLWSVALLQFGLPDRLSLFWLVMVPVLSAAVALLAFVLFGFWYTDAAAYTGLAGGLVVFAHTLDGLATVVGDTSFGLATRTAWTVTFRGALSDLPLATVAGVSETFVWAWLLLAAKMAFGVVVVAYLTRYARDRPSRGNVTLGVVTAAGLVPGVTTLAYILP